MKPLDTPDPRRVPSWIWLVLRLLGLPFVIYVVMNVKWDEVISMYRSLGLGTTLGMLTGLVGVFLVKVNRWSQLLRFQGIPRPWREVFRGFAEAYFYGFVTPARVGEAYRFRYLTEWGLDAKRAMGNLIMERGMDVCLLGSLALLSLGIYYTYPRLFGALFGLVLVAILLGGFWLLFRRLGLLRSWITRLDGSFGRQSILYSCAAQTAISWLILYLIVFSVRHVLGIPMGPVMTLFSFVLSTVVTTIPVSVAGFGTKELALMYFLARWGYTYEQAVAFSLIFAVIFVLNLLFSGAIWFAILGWRRPGRSV